MLLDLGLDRFAEELQVRTLAGKRQLYDVLRRQWLVLQPEEMVRQLLIQYLLQEKAYNKNRIAIERGLTVNGLHKRCDLLIFDGAMQPFMLVECKAPQVPLSEATFRQIAAYNLPLRVPYLLVCNGPHAYCCELDHVTATTTFLAALPDFPGQNQGEGGAVV